MAALLRVYCMNMKEASNALTAAKYAGLNARLTGRYTIRRIYNRIGDTMPFDPYLSLEDSAMIAMKCNLKLDFGSDCFKVSNGNGQELVITGLAKSREKQRIKRVGNAIVNLVVQISRRRSRTLENIDQEVLSLNPPCNEIVTGNMNRLIELAKEIQQ